MSLQVTEVQKWSKSLFSHDILISGIRSFPCVALVRACCCEEICFPNKWGEAGALYGRGASWDLGEAKASAEDWQRHLTYGPSFFGLHRRLVKHSQFDASIFLTSRECHEKPEISFEWPGAWQVSYPRKILACHCPLYPALVWLAGVPSSSSAPFCSPIPM